MQKGRALGYLTPALLALVTLLLGLVLLQMNNLEERFIAQGKQLRALGEATDRLASGGIAVVAGSKAPAADIPPGVKVLHPEVPNFLSEKETHWPPKGAKLDGTLVRGWPTGDPKGFNALIENAAELEALIEIYAGSLLATRNVWTDPDKFYGDLAWRVEITDDYKEFTIYLRKGVKWHEPSGVNLDDPRYKWLKGPHEFTAHDLVFTLDMATNPQVDNGFLKNYVKELESYKALDDYTFVVRWKKKEYLNLSSTLELFYPMPKFLYAHAEDGTLIPKETLGTRFNQHWYNNKGYVGTGPYRMASYEPGSKIRLVRNESYYGEKPAIKEIIYPIYTDPQQTLLKLKAHELSIGGLMPGQYREEIQQYESLPRDRQPKNSPFFDGRIQRQRIMETSYFYIGWNADKPIFADKRVRQAMSYAFNKQQMIGSVFAGLGKLTTSPYLPTTPYNDPSIKPYPFDLTKAKQLLTEAGWEDTDGDGLVDRKLRPGDAKRSPFQFTLLIYGTSKEYASLANIFKEDLLKIGVKMNIDAAEWSLLQKKMEEKNFDAYTGGWGLSWETDLFQTWHSSQADVPKGSNRIGFRNKEADLVIEKLRVTFDPAERTNLLRQFHRIVHEEQAYTFFFVRELMYCWWKDVHNVVFSKARPVVNALPWSTTAAR